MAALTFGGLPARTVTRSTVLQVAASYDLAKLDDVKADLGDAVAAGRNHDDLLKRYIANASAAAVQFCNRGFAAETIRDEFWLQRDSYPYQVPGGVGPLQLSRWPIVSVANVTENGKNLVENADFIVDAANGQLTRLGANGYPCLWPTWPIAVEYVSGFAEIPTDVQDAVGRMVKARWFARDRDPYLMSKTTEGIGSKRWWIASGAEAGNMPPDVVDILENYRVPVVG